MRFFPFAAVAVVAALLSCGGNEATTDDGFLFQGEGKLLEGFSFNSGAQPPTGPASVTLRLSGTGAVKVEARGALDGGKIAGKPATGKVDLDAHIKLDGTLKIDSPIKKSSGDIPGLKDIDIAIVGSAAFDPFLLDGAGAEVTAAIPETKLPDIPLGSVPGKLRLTVVSGSQLTSKFHASCMTVASGSAQYEGTAVTSGKLVIKGTIVLELPSPLDKEVELPEINVPIPSATSKVEFKPVAVSGASDDKAGSCSTGTEQDGGVDDASIEDSSADTSVVDDTGFVSDGASDGGSFDTSADTSPGTDTGPKPCPGEAFEPDNTNDKARVAAGITDCDGMEKFINGVLSSNTDVDVVRFDGEDTFGCAVNPYVKITGPVRVCMAVSCTGGTTDFQGCPKGARFGNECCGTTEVEADFTCNGTTKDSARVYLTVRASGTIAACTTYGLRYHY